MLKLVREVTPNYTAAALRAKVQGIVVVECVVLADGTIGDVKIIQSLDKIFGLDTLTPRSGDQTARVRAIDRMRPWGGTALYDVVLDALNRLGRQPGRRSMVFFTEDVSRLDGFFDEILEDLSNQYLVSYSYPDATRDGQWHRIRVEVDGRYRVRARPKYRLTRD